MTSPYEETAQPDQPIASENQNKGRPALNVTVIPPICTPWTSISKPVTAVFSSIRIVAGQVFWNLSPASSSIATPCTQEVVLNKIKELRESIARRVREFDPEADLPENLQTEVSKLAILLQRVERLVLRSNYWKNLSSLNSLTCSLEVELDSLFQKKYGKEFVRQISVDVEREVSRHERTPCTQEVVLSDIRKLRESIAKEVKEFDQKEKGLSESLQTEIPKLAILLQRVERLALRSNYRKKLSSLNSLVCSLDIALASLSQNNLSKEFTRLIRLDVEREVIRHEQLPGIGLIVNQFVYIWHSKSIRLRVIYGLSWSFVIMFGGLFSLGLIQYAAYSSNAETRKIEVLIDKKNKKVEELNARIEGVIAQVPKEIASPSPTSNEKRGIPDDVFDPKVSTIANLRRQIRETQANVLRLENQQEFTQARQNSLLHNVLSNIDVGFSNTLSQILWVAAAGTLGSIVSILIRVIGKSYDQEAYCDRLTPIFIGFFKPVIGASFGVLFLAFLHSGVVSTPLIPESNKPPGLDSASKTSDHSETKTAFFLFSVAFVVGFSERLAKDTITKLEGGSSERQEDLKGNSSRKS